MVVQFHIDGLLRRWQLYASQMFIEWDLVDLSDVLTLIRNKMADSRKQVYAYLAHKLI
jgi:hypothetical protein